MGLLLLQRVVPRNYMRILQCGHGLRGGGVRYLRNVDHGQKGKERGVQNGLVKVPHQITPVMGPTMTVFAYSS